MFQLSSLINRYPGVSVGRKSISWFMFTFLTHLADCLAGPPPVLMARESRNCLVATPVLMLTGELRPELLGPLNRLTLSLSH